MSNLIDILLKPYLSLIQSCVRDDIDLLNHLPPEINENEIFVSFDVTSLYSCIPHDLGMEAIQYWLSKRPDLLPDRISTEFVVNSIKLILENNSFQFGDRHFLQKNGTAMGTKFAPNYATLTLAYLEEKMYSEIEAEKGNLDTFLKFPLIIL